MPTAAFIRLRDFISAAMQMSHVYQPVMLRTLIDRGGKASVSDVAQALLTEDQSAARLLPRDHEAQAWRGAAQTRHRRLQRRMNQVSARDRCTPAFLRKAVSLAVKGEGGDRPLGSLKWSPELYPPVRV